MRSLLFKFFVLKSLKNYRLFYRVFPILSRTAALSAWFFAYFRLPGHMLYTRGDESCLHGSHYGENTGVLSLTKVFDPRVIRIAAGFAVLFSFSPKVAALIGCMPTATSGGVSLVLYGMISAVGVRNIVETQVDFTKSRNVIIAALILVLSIGINYSAAGAIAFHIGEITISLSGLAVGALTGIILNAILPGKDYKFDEDKPDDTGVCFAVKGEEN